MESTKHFEELLNAVHNFYPIGAPWSLGQSYKGKQKYKSLIAQKINSIIAKDENNWTAFINDKKVENQVPGFDMSHMQFPSYIMRYETSNKKTANYSFQRNLIVNVSLLCNFYTIFFEDSYIYNISKKLLKPKMTIVHSQDVETNEVQLYNIIKKSLETHFKDYKLIKHKFLFETIIIGGFLYTSDEEDVSTSSSSLYNFLFDAFFQAEHLAILE